MRADFFGSSSTLDLLDHESASTSKKSLRLEELHSCFSAEELSEQMYTDGRKSEIKEISAKPYRLAEEALHGIFIFLPSIFPGATR